MAKSNNTIFLPISSGFLDVWVWSETVWKVCTLSLSTRWKAIKHWIPNIVHLQPWKYILTLLWIKIESHPVVMWRQSICQQGCNGLPFPTTGITGDIIPVYDPPWPLHYALYFMCHQNCGIYCDLGSENMKFTFYSFLLSTHQNFGLCCENLSRWESQQHSIYLPWRFLTGKQTRILWLF